MEIKFLSLSRVKSYASGQHVLQDISFDSQLTHLPCDSVPSSGLHRLAKITENVLCT